MVRPHVEQLRRGLADHVIVHVNSLPIRDDRARTAGSCQVRALVAPRLADGYGADVSDFLNKATDALGDLKDNPLLDRAEDIAEDKAADGGTVGAIADKGDDVIDQIQGTKD